MNMEKEKSNFKEQLKEKGLRMTSQRQAVLDVIKESEGQHLSTEEIYGLLKEKDSNIGLATVYRTLLLLDSMELVYKTDFDDGCCRYEINCSREEHRHHHLICLKCGSDAVCFRSSIVSVFQAFIS